MHKLLEFANYTVIRCDRVKGGEGILVYHRDSYTISKIRIHPNRPQSGFKYDLVGQLLKLTTSSNGYHEIPLKVLKHCHYELSYVLANRYLHKHCPRRLEDSSINTIVQKGR